MISAKIASRDSITLQTECASVLAALHRPEEGSRFAL